MQVLLLILPTPSVFHPSAGGQSQLMAEQQPSRAPPPLPHLSSPGREQRKKKEEAWVLLTHLAHPWGPSCPVVQGALKSQRQGCCVFCPIPRAKSNRDLETGVKSQLHPSLAVTVDNRLILLEPHFPPQ